MANLPFGMTADIELSFTFEGDASEVICDVRRLREPGLKRTGEITALIKVPGQRRLEPFQLPSIIEGDGSAAMEQLDRLVHQSRIDANMERRLDELIKELIIKT